jgi:protein involved in polysaccharide export with SLBB domain
LKFVWLFIVLFLSQVLWAQRGDQASELKETTRSPVFDIDLNQFEKTNEQLVPQQQFLEQVFETEIDSTQYIMGPGDQLLIKIWGVLDTQFITAVTPEGYVIIPSVKTPDFQCGW